jgi:hypothetical protein
MAKPLTIFVVYVYNSSNEQKLVGVFSEKVPAPSRIFIFRRFSGEKLLTEFKKANRKVRPAVEKLIEEADEIAKAASVNYIDPTDDIFGDEETEA